MELRASVLIVGAGPVGLALALDLGRRGVDCLVIERSAEHSRLPKMERCHGRTMEIFRRLGIPTGGLGMNTGVGDATDLAWKLAAALAGWGGPGLLVSYEAERRPIGLRSIRAAGAAMAGRLSWRAAWRPDVRDDSPAGAETRAELRRRFDSEQRKITDILGIEGGYQYVDSPIVWPEPGQRPDPDNTRYVPTTWPGARLPHVWLEDGTALHDRLGHGFTLLRLGGTGADTSGLASAFRAIGAPLDVLEIPDAPPRELYGYDLLLVRPDLHVAWRGNHPPDDPGLLAAIVTDRHSVPRSSRP